MKIWKEKKMDCQKDDFLLTPVLNYLHSKDSVSTDQESKTQTVERHQCYVTFFYFLFN